MIYISILLSRIMYSKRELYTAFLQASAIRFSSVALSEVAPNELSHDVLSKWLKNTTLKPAEVWQESKQFINTEEPCVLIFSYRA